MRFTSLLVTSLLVAAAAAAEHPEAPTPPRETRPVSGVPLDVADELLGIADHAVVSVAFRTYVLPTATDEAAITTCTISVDGAAGAHLEWSLDLGKRPIVDGATQARWSGLPRPDGALQRWRDRLRVLTPMGTSCAQAVAALRGALRWRQPRHKRVADDAGEDLSQQWRLDRVAIFEGPDARSMLVAGYRGKAAWRWQVEPAPKSVLP